MTDISKCSGEGCQIRHSCRRFQDPDTPYRQAYIDVDPENCDSRLPYRRRVLVCGGRSFQAGRAVHKALNELRPSEVIAGDATGADALALDCAKLCGIPARKHWADWQRHGDRAGPIRNAEMLKAEPDLVLAFPGGKGTEDMVRQARKVGVRVVRWTVDGLEWDALQGGLFEDVQVAERKPVVAPTLQMSIHNVFEAIAGDVDAALEMFAKKVFPPDEVVDAFHELIEHPPDHAAVVDLGLELDWRGTVKLLEIRCVSDGCRWAKWPNQACEDEDDLSGLDELKQLIEWVRS